jgi:Flp pilus assembly protein TadD
VAALFAIHPLNVESVAWVAERKNVLSTFFWLLTMWAYARYAQKQSRVEGRGSRAGSGSLALDPRRWTLDYGLVLFFFALGLMSKPMLVTLPFVLLLLDYWPLGRVTGGEWWGTGPDSHLMPHASRFTFHVSRFTPQISHLLFEKLPLFGLAVASSVMTYLGQKSGGAMMTFEQSPLGVRLAKVPVNYVIYLRNTIWPEGLAIPYPCPPAYPVFLVALCTLLLAGVTLLVLWAARTRPYAAVGWFWFLGTLVPVIGLVQVGGTPVADRFTYVPQIGLYLAAAWMIRDWTVSWRYRRQALGLAATLVITALMVCAWKQTSYWRNSETLWRHALACTSGTDTAGNNPDKALPDQGLAVGAIRRFAKALDVTPPNILAQIKLGEALIEQGKFDEGIAHLNAALQMNPTQVEVHARIAQALARQGKFRESVNEYDETLRCQPDFSSAINNLAWMLATNPDAGLRDGARAVQLAERACEITGRKETIYLGTLAAAYAEAGRFDDAIATAQQACDLAAQSGKPDLLKKNQKLLELYRAHKPYRE